MNGRVCGCVGTNDLDKGAEIASKIQSGVRGVNAHPGSKPGATPFGGVKQSGNGREGGEMGLREFLEVKTIAGWPS